MKRIVPALIAPMFLAATVLAAPPLQTTKPQIKVKSGVQNIQTKPKPRIQQRVVKLNVSKIRTSYEIYDTSLSWEIDIINRSNGPLPANLLEYKVSQTLNGGNPVLMLKGTVHEPMTVGKQVTLKNTIQLCCGYNKIKIEIRDKTTGKVLVSTGAPMPVEPARARVQVTDATYRLSPKPVGAVVTYKNHASMPILVKAILFRKGPGSPNAFTKVDERKIHFYPNQTESIFYGQKAGAFDQIRVELTQQSPAIHCPRNQCVAFPTYEGNFVGQ